MSEAKKVNDEIAIVSCGTTKGPIVIELYRAWSPNGYDRAVHLFEIGFYDSSHFFRMVPKFLVQFGITYNTTLKSIGRTTILDDPQLDPPVHFIPGTLSYAGNGPNSRTSQLFIAFGPGSFGTELWETPIGQVTKGIENVNNFYNKYGDMPPWGKGPVQGKIHDGPQYIEQHFPEIDRFEKCAVERMNQQQQEQEHLQLPVVDNDTFPKPSPVAAVVSVEHTQIVQSAKHKVNDPLSLIKGETGNVKVVDDKALLRKTTHHNHHEQHPDHDHRLLDKKNEHTGSIRSSKVFHQQHLHNGGTIQHPHQLHIPGGLPQHNHIIQQYNTNNHNSNHSDVIMPQHHGHATHLLTKIKEAGPIEEGVTILSWELLSICLVLFLGVLMIWLNFVLKGSSRKVRKTQ